MNGAAQRCSLYDLVKTPGSFAILMQLLSATLTDRLIQKSLDPYTLIAVTDNAFRKWGRDGMLNGINNADNKAKFVRYLIIQGAINQADISRKGASFKTVAGPQISLDKFGLTVHHSTKSSNGGWVHVIDDGVPVNPDVQKIIYPHGVPTK